MQPDFSNRPPGALSPSELFARVQKRGTRLRQRRRIVIAAATAALAGGIAALVLAVIPGSTPHRVVVTGPSSSSTTLTPGGSCPVSPFIIDPAPAGSLPVTSALTSGAYRHLGVGQTVTLFAENAPPDRSITLTRGVDLTSFAVSLWSHGPKPLTPVAVLGSASMLYPPGYGTPGARIPFRYPQAGSQSDPCQRYQLQAVGVSDSTLITLAENLQAPPSGPPSTTNPQGDYLCGVGPSVTATLLSVTPNTVSLNVNDCTRTVDLTATTLICARSCPGSWSELGPGDLVQVMLDNIGGRLQARWLNGNPLDGQAQVANLSPGTLVLNLPSGPGKNGGSLLLRATPTMSVVLVSGQHVSSFTALQVGQPVEFFSTASGDHPADGVQPNKRIADSIFVIGVQSHS